MNWCDFHTFDGLNKLKMKKYLLPIVIVMLLSSCLKRKKSDNLHYFQDCESIKGWFGVNSLTSEIKAHSGTYAILTNQKFDYSMSFTSSIAEISSKPLMKIRASVWCLSPSKLFNGGFCVQIVNPANENKLWITKPFADFIKTENSWTKTVIEADIPKEALSPDNVVKVFLWNQGTVPVYADDFAIEFTE